MLLQGILQYRQSMLGECHVRVLNTQIWIGWCFECSRQPLSALGCYQYVLSRLSKSPNDGRYSASYRANWLQHAVSRNVMSLRKGGDELDDFASSLVNGNASEPLEILTRDGSPVQCIIEEESTAPETYCLFR